ncbi:MAG: coniferyl aldehyde dehydrogenase [Pseudomonadota bacterium]
MPLDAVSTTTLEEMNAILARQKAAHVRDGQPSAARRKEWLDRCIGLMVDHQNDIVEAIASDFGWRSKDASAFTDVMGSISSLKFAKARVEKWMRTQRRNTEFPLGLFGAKTEVRMQPKGVVGLVSPWNFPVTLTFGPMAGIFAAGNRVMIKPSEFTPATSELMKRMVESAFSEEEAAVLVGGPDIGSAFTSLPFDHLIFTGATSIGKLVMRAASENLTPVTLELGGKSPVVIGRSADMQKVANRVMAGKTLNAGQICLAPDYVMTPKELRGEFVDAAQEAVRTLYPTLKDNDDYTSIVSQRHYDRLNGYLEEARDKGAETIEINPAGEDFSQQPHYKIPPTLILDPTDDMAVMQDEIFGPILPVKTYSDVRETVDYVNANPRPLGLYYFGEDAAEREDVVNNTTSGGVTVNDVIMHVGAEDAPFGGVGPSGMGAYHGYDGFLEFTHKKTVYTQMPGEKVASMLRPPYDEKFRKMVAGRIKR